MESLLAKVIQEQTESWELSEDLRQALTNVTVFNSALEAVNRQKQYVKEYDLVYVCVSFAQMIEHNVKNQDCCGWFSMSYFASDINPLDTELDKVPCATIMNARMNRNMTSIAITAEYDGLIMAQFEFELYPNK